jgi:hypothetical protein
MNRSQASSLLEAESQSTRLEQGNRFKPVAHRRRKHADDDPPPASFTLCGRATWGLLLALLGLLPGQAQTAGAEESAPAVAPSAALSSAVLATNTLLTLTDYSLSGGATVELRGSPGRTNLVEASPSLSGPWIAVSTNILSTPGGVAVLDDGRATNVASRFYRARDAGDGTLSCNMVGLANVAVSNWFTMAACQFLHPGGNTLGNILPQLREPVFLYKFSPATGGWVANSYDPFFGWDDPEMTLMPGEGCFVEIFGPTAITLTFKGSVPQGNLTNVIGNYISIYSSILPLGGALETELSFPAREGDYVYLFRGGQFEGPYVYFQGFWVPSEPTVTPGEAFFVVPDPSFPIPFRYWAQTNSRGTSCDSDYWIQPLPCTTTAAELLFDTRNSATNKGRVFNSNGLPLSGCSYKGQLYGGRTNQEDALVPVGGAECFGSGSDAGYIENGVVSIPGASSGDTVYLQLRVWQTNGGATYESAVSNGVSTGKSEVFAMIAGGCLGGGASLPPPAANDFESFAVSEPTPPPVILQHPQSQTVIVGTNVTFSVIATGAPPLTYEWYFNDHLISAATSSNLILLAVRLTNSGTYYVKVSNIGGSTNSNPATLLVKPVPAELGIELYAGLTVTGTVGGTYIIQYTTNFKEPRVWWDLTNLTLTKSPEFWLDPTPANKPRRFYRAEADP